METILKIPYNAFGNDWDRLQKYLKIKGDPLYGIIGDVDLTESEIKTLGNLISVSGNLYLYGSTIESLGKLKSVGFCLDLRKTKCYLKYPVSKIRENIDVGGVIYI